MFENIKINRLGLQSKIILAFVLVALLVGVTGAVGYHGVGVVDEEAHIIAEDAEKMDTATEMSLAVEKQQEAVLYAELGNGEKADELFTEGQDLFASDLETFQAEDLSGEEAELVSSAEATHEEYEATATAAIDAAEAGNMELAEEHAAEARSLGSELEASASELHDIQKADLDNQVAIADETTQTTQMEMIGLTLLAFIAAIAIGLFVARRISTPIVQLSEAAVAASEGDLSADVDDHVEEDEIGRMVDSFAEMQTNLQSIFHDLENVSEGLASGKLDSDIDTDYPGTYGRLMKNLDETTNQLNESFDEIQQASENLRDQELDNDIETEKAGRYGEVLQAVDDGIDEINRSLLTVQEISQEVAAASDEAARTAESVDKASQTVASSVQELTEASEEVARSVEEISAGTEDQNSNLQQVSGEMNDLSATVEEIASSTEEVSMTAQNAVEHSKKGQEYAAEATEEISAIESKASKTADQVETLDEKMDQIGEINDLIIEIA